MFMTNALRANYLFLACLLLREDSISLINNK